MDFHYLPIKRSFSLFKFQITGAHYVQSKLELHINMFYVHLRLLRLFTIEKLFCVPIYCTNLSETS